MPFIADRKNVQIEISIDSNLSSIYADEARFAQIMYNLVNNAIKFSYENGLVKIGASKKGNMVEITVTDTGIGIKPEDQGKLFKPFSQVDSFLSKQYQGTGFRWLSRLYSYTADMYGSGANLKREASLLS